MSQFAVSEGQPGNWEEPDLFLRRFETVRFQEEGWQEPDESTISRTGLAPVGDLRLRGAPIYGVGGYFGKTVDYANKSSFQKVVIH
jgi:hypothetical protein